MADPEFLYRLINTPDWARALNSGVVPLRDIDVADGYMHLSTREQVLETARLHFAGAKDLLALEIPLAEIKENLKFELAPKRGEKFPHLYGTLAAGDVARAIRLGPSGDGFTFGGLYEGSAAT